MQTPPQLDNIYIIRSVYVSIARTSLVSFPLSTLTFLPPPLCYLYLTLRFPLFHFSFPSASRKYTCGWFVWGP